MRPDGTALPIYGPPAEAALLAAVDRTAQVIGKVVDRREGGLGMELWVADGSAVRSGPPDVSPPAPR